MVNLYYFAIRSFVTGNLTQTGRIIGVDSSVTAASVGYAIIRVLLPVSRSVYYPCRSCIGYFSYFRTVNVYCIINYPAAAVWPVNVVNVVNTHVTVVGNLPDLVNSWAGYVGTVIINIGVVNNCCLMNNVNYPCLRHIIIIDIRPGNICLWRANPVVVGHIVTIAKRDIDTYTRL